MIERMRTGVSGLIGLAIGIALALPLFWVGVRRSVGALRHQAYDAFGVVEGREQGMADECLKLEQRLAGLGFRDHKKDFARVELLRSRLAGENDFEEKLELSQHLERAMLNVETAYDQTKEASDLAASNPFVKQFGLDWLLNKRYLVDEERTFSIAVKHYNEVLERWPVPAVIGHKTFSGLLRAMTYEIFTRGFIWLGQGARWLAYGIRWLWATLLGNIAPEPPLPLEKAPLAEDALYQPLPQPLYIAEAPVPEEDYPEIQYDRDAPDMADVEVGQEKAVLDNKRPPAYAAPVPTVQKTATYR
jgi:hypothetical protein